MRAAHTSGQVRIYAYVPAVCLRDALNEKNGAVINGDMFLNVGGCTTSACIVASLAKPSEIALL